MNVVAHERAAQQHRVRGDIRAAALLDAQRGNVEGLRVFALDHVMRDHRCCRPQRVPSTVLQRAAPPSERHIIFDDGGLAAFFRDDQVARMSHHGRIMRGGDEEQMNRRFQNRALCATCTNAPSSIKAVFSAENASRWISR